MKHTRSIIIPILILILVVFAFCFKPSMQYDNTTASTMLITEQYSTETINELKSRLEEKQLTYRDLLLEFHIECMRKTYQGYYAVLAQSDGCNAYVFIDTEGNVYDILTFDEFLSTEDFEHINKNDGSVTMTDVLSADPNAIGIPLSMCTQTAHIVQEGVVLVSYSLIRDGTLLSEPIAVSAELYSDEYIIQNPGALIAQCVPFILTIDKSNE